MKNNKSEFDEYADDYMLSLSNAVNISGAKAEYFHKQKVSILTKHEESNERLQILDFGCGDGNSEFHFSKLFPLCQLTGIDTSERSIELANQKGIPNADFKSYDGRHIPFENNYFDIAFTSMVFHHIHPDDHSKALSEVFRVLKPGGRFYLFEHNPQNILTRRIVNKCVFDKNAVLIFAKEMYKKIKFSGFENVETSFILFFPRNGIFKLFHPLEKKLGRNPFGAQYYIKSIKP